MPWSITKEVTIKEGQGIRINLEEGIRGKRNKTIAEIGYDYGSLIIHYRENTKIIIDLLDIKFL